VGKPTPWERPALPKALKRYVEHGLAVIPQVVDHKKKAKVPRVSYAGYVNAPAEIEVVEAWYLKWGDDPNTVWAIVAGRIYFVLDFDERRGGVETLHRLGLKPTVLTPRDGAHVYVELPDFDVPQAYEVDGFAGMEVHVAPHPATFLGRTEDGEYRLTGNKAYAFEQLPMDLQQAIRSVPRKESSEPFVLPHGFSDWTPVGRLIELALAKVVEEGRNRRGYILACWLRAEGHNEVDAEAIITEKYLPLVTSLKDHPYTRGEVVESVASAFSGPPMAPMALRRTPEDVLEERRQNIRLSRQANRDVDQEEAAAAFVTPPSRQDGVEEMSIEDGPENDRLNALLKENQLALLSGPQKAGKTIALMNCGLDMIRGDFFLGRFAARALDGLLGYWNYEVDERQWRQWARRMGWGAVQRRWAVNHLAGYSMYLETDVAAEYAIDWLRSRGVEVWIIDIMNRAFGGNWQSDNQETYRFFERLEQIRREAGVSEILMSSQFSVHGQGRAGGCAALDAAPSVLWTLSKHASKRTFSAFGRGVDVGEQDFSFDAETLRLSSGSGQNRRSLKETDLVIQALQIARSYPALGKNALKGRMEGGRNQDFNNAIADAVLNGFLRVERSGQSDLHYLTQDGEGHLALHVGGR
jgi:hypothetical protein